jgi:hypothetical protein
MTEFQRLQDIGVVRERKTGELESKGGVECRRQKRNFAPAKPPKHSDETVDC